MALRITIAVVLGGGIGLLVGMAGRAAGGQCPILCNPYVSTGFGVVIALFLASRSETVADLVGAENLVEISSEEEYDALVRSDSPVLVAFYTDYCPACHRQVPELARLADDRAGKVSVAVVNAGKLRGVATRENVNAVPTLLLYRAGELQRRIEGFTSAEKLAKMLDAISAPRNDTGGENTG